jgi:uncharacterized lipoprotein YajG
MLVRSILPLLAIILLAGCSDGSTAEAGSGGVSAEDAKALDDAAAKLDSETSGSPANEGTAN